MRCAAGLLVALACSGAVAGQPGQRALTFEDRVAAQKAIEQVYWNHRIWPKENTAPKPPLSTVMTDEAIRANVRDYLEKSNALETWWQRPITGEQLQAELDRMAHGSRDTRVLQELFDALHGDAFVIAETLARPTLVDRLARNWYATDARIHGTTRLKAEAALARCQSVACMKAMGGQYAEETVRMRRDDDGVGPGATGDPADALDVKEWRERLERLAPIMGRSPASVSSGKLSELQETPDAFVVSAVLSQKDGALVTATTSWPKETFEAWWSIEREEQSIDVVAASGSLRVPSLDSGGCANDTWTPTHLEAPDMRSEHTAVWTGTEMIVWGGGAVYGARLNTGGRYNPSTDTWAPTSRGPNVPAARGAYTAVWTGTEMIIWGGAGGVVFNDGGRYNPTTDSWTPTSMGMNVPSVRYQHSAVWTGSEMVVWGGYTSSSPTDALNTGGVYNPMTDSWRPISTAAGVPAPRGALWAVWTGTEMIVWGGSNATGNLNSGGRYNPSTDSWRPTSTGAGVPSGNTSGKAVWTGTEVFFWGYAGLETAKGALYNPVSDTWSAVAHDANEPPARLFYSAVWTGKEVIVWGGHPFYPEGGRYNPATKAWSRLTTTGAPYAREYHTAVWTGSEMIVWGGENCNGNCPGLSNTGGRYNPATDSWVPTQAEVSVPGARAGHTAVWTGTEMIVWGGRSGSSTQAYLNSGGRYVPATDTWLSTSVGANVPTPRHGQAAVWTGAEMLVWGGIAGQYYPTVNDGGRYNPLTDSWTPISTGLNVPATRTYHSAVWTGAEMLVWGGYTAVSCCSSVLNSGGLYNPTTDQWRPTSAGVNVPAGRWSHAAAWTGTQMIVWGGFGIPGSPTPALGSGGRYVPSTDTWSSLSTAGAPQACANCASVWTGTEMIVWGGESNSVYLGTGGRYAPSTDTWTPVSQGANVPTARTMFAGIWTGQEMIVWGGYSRTAPVAHDDGGRYDPSTDTWTPTSRVLAPPPRSSHSAVWTGTEMIVWGGSPAYSTAGRYCACPSGRLAYRDADGDGYGDPSVSIPSCDGSIPLGYSFSGSDCNDSNPSIYPGAPEINDGIDNQCPGDQGFGVIDEISGMIEFVDPADKTRLGWSAQGAATSYDVVRSDSPDFSSGCTLFSTGQAFIVDAKTPVLGHVYYYLVRPAAPHVGSWGQNSDGTPRSIGCLGAGN